MSEFDTRLVKRTASSHGFRTMIGESDKRLASVCATTNTVNLGMLDRERQILLYLKDIDRIRFNSIPKLELWREIYSRFI